MKLATYKILQGIYIRIASVNLGIIVTVVQGNFNLVSNELVHAILLDSAGNVSIKKRDLLWPYHSLFGKLAAGYIVPMFLIGN